MDKGKYLKTCEMLRVDPEPDKMPPDYEDFPSYVHVALEIFNALPDLYSGGMSPIYTGKDFASLSVLYDLFEVDNDEKLLIFRVIQQVDARARKQAADQAKKQAKQAKKGSK